MNYDLSPVILEKAKAAKKILINCHQSPDPDSVGSSIAMHLALKKIGKESDIVCVDELPPELDFLPNKEVIQKVDFSSFDYGNYDLFLALDTSSWKGIVVDSEIPLPTIEIITLDHHRTNVGWGSKNIIDIESTSTCEVLYKLFEDWGIEINYEIALSLFVGIVGDTGSFQFHTGVKTLEIAAKLLQFGINKDEINFKLYKNLDFFNLAFMGQMLIDTKIDEEAKFVWVAIPWEKVKNFPEDHNLEYIDIILQSVKDTKFGIRMIEKEPNMLRVSFRGREDIDTSAIAVELGGGGHKAASGAVVKDLPFDQAVEKVLSVARKYAK